MAADHERLPRGGKVLHLLGRDGLPMRPPVRMPTTVVDLAFDPAGDELAVLAGDPLSSVPAGILRVEGQSGRLLPGRLAAPDPPIAPAP